MNNLKADLCVIGAGSAGLSVAAGAAQLGLKVVLFEAREMGGDCLNWGCVPSKALIAAAHAAHSARDAAKFGIAAEPRIDWPAVRAHVKRTIETIAPIDSQERFEGLGVTVIRERARFTDPGAVQSQSVTVTARRFVLAAGSHPAIPNISGLRDTPFHTNETIFDIDGLPEHLVVLGGGAIGVELGQAFRRLGAHVTIIEAAALLGAADSEAAGGVRARLRAEGITLLEGWKAKAAAAPASLTIENAAGETRTISGTHLLVAVGRTPALADLGLDAARIAYDAKGVKTDAFLRTTNRRVWALGDAAGRQLFTHVAGWHASAFVRTALFKAATKADSAPIPRVVYADPELAEVGLTHAQAVAQVGEANVRLVRWAFHENDRAIAESDSEGFCKLVLDKKGRILGATILGAHAGDLLAPLILAMSAKLTVRALTGPVLPYPTRSEIWKRAAGAFYTPLLFSPRTKALVSVLQRLP